MKPSSIHSQLAVAKQAGFMPTYWSAISLQSNDRTPEGMSGSIGGGSGD